MIRWHLALGQPGLPRRENQKKKLLAHYFFHFPNFLLHFAADFFGLTSSFQIRIINGMADPLFDRAFHFMSITFDPIFCAVFHGFLLRHVNSTSSSVTESPRSAHDERPRGIRSCLDQL